MMTRDDEILHIKHDQDGVWIVTCQGHVWRLWLDCDGLPVIEKRMDRGGEIKKMAGN